MKWFEIYLYVARGAGVLAAAALAAACAEDPPGFAVRGTATGVSGPVTLELRLGEDIETLSVTQDGAFAFDSELQDGDAYDVALSNPDVPCTLRDQSGAIAGEDGAVELTCTGASLASVVVSGFAPAVALEPGTSEYVIDVPLSQPAATLTASVTIAGDTLTIAGTPVASGAPSAEIALSLGDNPVDIVVENDLGWQRTYRLTLRRAAQLAQYAYTRGSNTEENDEFSTSVALAGDTLVVGDIRENSAATGVDGDQDDDSADTSGAVYVFRRTGTSWQQEAYLKASNTGVADHFGSSVALAGDTLAVGAPGEDSAATGVNGAQDDDSAEFSGAVYVFRRTGTTWQQEAYLKASNTGSGDVFGARVALAGELLAIGAYHEDSAATGVDGDQADDAAPSSGAVYVFRRTGTTWQQEAYLKASNTDPGDSFGSSVALAGDTLAVGASSEASAATGVNGNQADDSIQSSGAVYVFRRTGTTWQQEAYLKASNTSASLYGDHFGSDVALAGDTLAVGAYGEGSAATGVDGDQASESAPGAGAVYVFRRAGTTWKQEAYLKASNTGAEDYFGFRLALSGDRLAVGADSEDSAATGVDGDQADDSVMSRGAAYVFHRTGTTWQQQAYVKASTGGVSFGHSLALSEDTLAVGQRWGLAGDVFAGVVYIFH